MKGILLAGGKGSRLGPLTVSTSKQLLPVYSQPMIHFSLSSLLLAGVRDVLLISDSESLPRFERLLGSGGRFGIDIRYKEQIEPNGIAEALIIGEKFINSSNCVLALGDNIIHGSGLSRKFEACVAKEGATILAAEVENPAAYGVVEFDRHGQVQSLEEKPIAPKSRFAVPGFYFYDGDAVEIAKSLRPSKRGELEITDVNLVYLAKKKLHAEKLERGTTWIDSGTIESLADATEYVRAIEKRQGQKIGCPDEVSWRLGLISDGKLGTTAKQFEKSDYGQYLFKLLGS